MRLQFRRSPPFGRLDLRFVSSFVLQHPVMADDDVDAFLVPRRLLRDLRRQDVDTTMMCPGVTRGDVSILHAIVRSRTTSIDEVHVIGPRSSSLFTSRDSSFIFFFFLVENRPYVSPMSTKTVSTTVSSLLVDRPHLRVATMIPLPDRSSLHPRHRHHLFSPPLLNEYNFRVSGRRTTTSE